MSVKIAIIFYSGYGHTAKLASSVYEGVKSVNNTEASLINISNMQESDWEILNQSDAIIFGSPTYMGSLSADFKKFIDQTSKIWAVQLWKDKLAAGFTNGSSPSGDQMLSLIEIMTMAMQHGMIWVGLGLLPAQGTGTGIAADTAVNRIGSYIGSMSFSNNEPSEITPSSGDLETARLLGMRVAEITAKFKK